MNNIFLRYNYNTSRMLTCCTLYTCTARNKAVNLCICRDFTFFVVIFFYKAVCCLFCNCTYCTCTENMPFTKKLFNILMCNRLIFSGKVKVDIRLFITLKAEECLEWYIMPVLNHWLSAFRAVFIRQVETATNRTVCKKFVMLTLRANIMRRK